MKIIVDSNIIFSALLRTETTYGQIIFNSDGLFEFYSPKYLRDEIQKHWSKLIKISKLSDQQLDAAYFAILSKISFINEELIPQKIWEESEAILLNVDLDDIDFIALTKYIKGKLWTGDKALYLGLKKQAFKRVLNTEEITKLWSRQKSTQ
jgi:predicted nucleic acid-binding protein